MASIEYRRVSKAYDDGTVALSELDLAIADGELMVLVGPSGCGKSTALRLLAGLDSPTAGELLLDGAVINALPPRERNLAMVFQNYALYPHMTVRANLAFPLKMARLPRAEIEQRVARAASLLQLESLLDRKPAQLSGGQRQRVAMGRALVREPRAFLLDEPLSNLDAQLRVQIRTEIAALQQRLGVTMIHVTHDQVEAMTLGQRVAVLERGRLQQVDTPQTLYDRPANLFVAGFIGSPGMNLIRVRLEEALVLRCGDFRIPLPVSWSAHTGLARKAGQRLWLGVRPEAVQLQTSSDEALPAEVVAVELLGHERLVYLAAPWLDDERICARTTLTQPMTVGDRVSVTFDPDALHFFGPDGNAITR